MDDTSKRVLLFGIGLLVGAAAGGAGIYLYCKKYFKDVADAEIKEMADYYNNKYADDILKEGNGHVINEIKEESNEQERAEQEEYVEKTSLYNKGEETNELDKVNYTNCFGDTDAGNSSSGSSPKKKGGRKKKKQEIELVGQETWDENPGGLDSKFLVFYDADSVLVDEESEQIIENDLIVKAIEANDDNIDDTLIFQTADSLYHVTIERMAYSEVMVDD